MADKKKPNLTDPSEYMKRRSKLAGLTSVNFSSALKDMPKPAPSRISNVAKKIFKKSPVGKLVDFGVKAGIGAGAMAEYLDRKSKNEDKKSEEVKVDKKATGGMADYIKDLL